jgi:hypothetical protein
MQAVSILFACVNWLSVVKGVYESSIELLAPLLPSWLQLFVPYLSRPDSFDGDCGIKIIILQVRFDILPSVYVAVLSRMFMCFVFCFKGYFLIIGISRSCKSISKACRSFHERHCATHLEILS